MRPFLLEDRHEDKVEFVEQHALAPQALLRVRALDDEVDDKVADASVCQRQRPRGMNTSTYLGTGRVVVPSIWS